jgi:adenine-specific DNA-methyltransferase
MRLTHDANVVCFCFFFWSRPPMTSNLELVRETLGAPAYSRDGVLIYCMDCVEGLEALPKGIFDLTVTSPPYNIGKEYEKATAHEVYLDWCERWIQELYRTCASSGAFWLNLGYVQLPGRAKAIPIPYMLWDRVPFFMLQEVVWHYGAGVAARKTFSPRNEKWLWYVKTESEYRFNLDDVRDPNVKYPNQKKNGKLKCNPLGKNPTDVWSFPKVTSGRNRSSVERTSHPAQFPIAIIERIVKACSNEGDLLIDPFMGSGSTAEVAVQLNRPVVGFEIRPDYIDIAADRIERAATRPKQADLGLVQD